MEREQFGARFFEPPSNGLGLRVGGPQYAPHSPIDVLKDGHRLSRVVFLDDRLRQCSSEHVVAVLDRVLLSYHFGGRGHAAHGRGISWWHAVRVARRRVGGAVRVQRPFSGRLPGRGGA